MANMTYGMWHKSFWDEFKAAITPELKMQVCDSATLFVKATFTGFWQLLALAVIAVCKATIRVPKV